MNPKFSLSKVICLAALLVATASLLPAQQDAVPPGWNDTGQPAPGRNGVLTIHTGVQLVLQDIAVTDANGHPVTGLKLEDFHIFEDGRPQTIKNFEEHAPVDPALAEQRAAELAHSLPPNTFTNYKPFKIDTVAVFVIDTLDTTECEQLFLHEYMTDYMKTQPAGTQYIIFQLDTGLHMLQDMTTDQAALRAWVQGKRDPVEIQHQLAPEDARYPTWPAALRRRQIVTAATNELQRYLAAIPGRKNLIWFGALGGGLTTIDPTSLGPPPTHVSFDPVTLTPIYTDPDSNPDLFRQEALPDPSQMKKTPATGAYLQDMRASLAQSRIVMNTIAIGCPFYQYGVSQHIAAVVDRGAHYYNLSYTPTNQNWTGKPRTFSVQLADPTLHLDYRRTYVGSPNDTTIQRATTPAPTAASTAVVDNAAGSSIPMQTAMGMGTIEPTQVVFEASATPAAAETKDPGNAPPAPGNFLAAKLRKQGYRDYTVHFRVRADELKLTPSDDDSSYTGKLDLVAVVYDNQGQAVNGKREKTSVSFPNLSDPDLQTASLTGDLVIQVPIKGVYFLRLGVRDAATDRVGALEIPIDPIPGK